MRHKIHYLLTLIWGLATPALMGQGAMSFLEEVYNKEYMGHGTPVEFVIVFLLIGFCAWGCSWLLTLSAQSCSCQRMADGSGTSGWPCCSMSPWGFCLAGNSYPGQLRKNVDFLFVDIIILGGIIYEKNIISSFNGNCTMCGDSPCCTCG